MQFTRKTVTTLFMVALVALAGIGAFAGSTSAATTTLAGDGTDTVTGFEANASNDIAYSISADDATNGFGGDSTETLKMNVTYDGETYAVTSEAVSDSTATSQTVNITNDELADLPGDAGETVNVTVNAWGEGADGSVNTSVTTFSADITFANTHAVTSVDDSAATIEERDVGILSSSWSSLSSLWSSSSSDEPADLHTYEQTVGVDGSNTTVTLTDKTTNGSDAFDNAIGDKESGDVIYSAAAGVDGTPVLAFYQSANSDMVDENSTYAVYDQNGNGDWTFHLGDDYSDASSVDVFASSQSYTDVSSFNADDLTTMLTEQADMSMTSALSTFGFGAFSSLNLFSMASIPFVGSMAVPSASLAGLGLVAGRTRIGA